MQMQTSSMGAATIRGLPSTIRSTAFHPSANATISKVAIIALSLGDKESSGIKKAPEG
jgi:hypothetical protein